MKRMTKYDDIYENSNKVKENIEILKNAENLTYIIYGKYPGYNNSGYYVFVCSENPDEVKGIMVNTYTKAGAVYFTTCYSKALGLPVVSECDINKLKFELKSSGYTFQGGGFWLTICEFYNQETGITLYLYINDDGFIAANYDFIGKSEELGYDIENVDYYMIEYWQMHDDYDEKKMLSESKFANLFAMSKKIHDTYKDEGKFVLIAEERDVEYSVICTIFLKAGSEKEAVEKATNPLRNAGFEVAINGACCDDEEK